jgi:hypothetical protein
MTSRNRATAWRVLAEELPADPRIAHRAGRATRARPGGGGAVGDATPFKVRLGVFRSTMSRGVRQGRRFAYRSNHLKE